MRHLPLSPSRNWTPFFMLWLLLMAVRALGDADAWLVKEQDVPPPKEKRGRASINSGESVSPPSPGPPLCPIPQSERKKPPSPDALMGKLKWGQSAMLGGGQGLVSDWSLAEHDTRNLINMAAEMGEPVLQKDLTLGEFDYDPVTLPCLWISGVRGFNLSEPELRAMRAYVQDGGMLVFDSVYGSPYFTDSVRELVTQRMFPGSRFRPVPLDHPLYHLDTDTREVTYAVAPTDTNRPNLETVYVGSRAAILLSPAGLGMGLQNSMGVFKQLQERGLTPIAYAPESAKAIGRNLSAYIMGYAQVGEVEGMPEGFGLPDQQRPAAEFVFAQIKHDGHWNVHPGAAVSLLRQAQRGLSMPVHLKRIPVSLGEDTVETFPFLYLTGLDVFSFSEAERSRLRRFVETGGRLLVNNGMGLATFDAAWKNEFKAIFPDRELKELPADHPVFSSYHAIESMRYTPATAVERPALGTRPLLYGVDFDGETRILYSPVDLEAGWLGIPYPQIRGVEPASANRLGINLLVYFLTY